MVFGSFSENYEFAAMKSTGISLQRAMKSLTFFIVLLSILVFFFANNVIPYSEYKWLNLRRNIQQFKPSMVIAEGQFSQIGDGFNIKVDEKSGDNDQYLSNIVIHQKDAKRISGNHTVIIADNGELTSEEGSNTLSLVLKDGNYYSGWGTQLYKFADINKGDINSEIEIVKQIDLKDFLPEDKASTISRLVGLNITYDGYIVIGMPGIVAVMDRDLTNMEYVLFEGEAIDNGISTDEDGGIYVVTSKYMRKLIWDGKDLSDDENKGAWKSKYDYVPNPKAASRGAGNTPTLMGFGPNEDHLVIVCDAGDPIKVTAFWRDEIPADFKQKEGAASRRIADQKALSIDVPATIEWSPHVKGYGVMMFASAWPDPVRNDNGLDVYSTVHTAGVSRKAPRGSEKFEWNPKTQTLESKWTTDYGM